MDVIKAVQHYAEKMINDVPGMKALLLDTETVSPILDSPQVDIHRIIIRHLLYL